MNSLSSPGPSGDYAAAVAYLSSRIDYERSPPPSPQSAFKLDRMRRLLALLGNPQDGLPIVHVAGTKGKGSTATMIASVLTAAGQRTGLYTSPHLTSIEQRWRVDGQAAAPAELPELVEIVRRAAEELDAGTSDLEALGRPTFFELTTAMALVHFRRHGCTAAVLEVGMGGRLDATNVCQPLVTVITTISFDHMKWLGNTLAAIAGEKAGILKPGIPCVVGVSASEPREVINRQAAAVAAPMCGIGTEFDYIYHPPATLHEVPMMGYWELSPDAYRLADVQLAMRGEHQAANAAVAIATIRQLQRQGWNLSESAIRQGLAQASCPARVEIFLGPPLVVIDAAHNVASVESLMRVLENEFRGKTGRLIFAASSDKEVEQMLSRLAPRFQSLYLTRFVVNPRSVPPAQLAGLVTQLQERTPWRRGSPGLARPTVWDNPLEAWRQAVAATRDDEFICIAGSFFLAAELRPVVARETAVN